MLHSEQKCAHFCSEWSIVGYGTGAFWVLWIRPIILMETTTHFEQSQYHFVSDFQTWHMTADSTAASQSEAMSENPYRLTWLLTHLGRATHICVSILNHHWSRLSPVRRQAIIRTNDGLLLTGRLGTSFGEILNEIHTCWFKKMHSKMSSVKWRPYRPGEMS